MILDEALQAIVGRAERPVPARDPVSLTRIRAFVEAVGDECPIYLDETAARAAGLPGVVAPPGLLQAWTMPGLGPARDESGPTAALYRLLDDHDYPGLIAVGYAQEYPRYLVPGDQLTAHATIASVSAEKQTWLGPGYFLSTAVDYRDATGAVAGTMTWTVLKYRPEPSPRRAPAAETEPAATPLPTLTVPVSATTIVAGALATNDFAPIHHDVRAATTAGFDDIFMNILTTCGLVCRYLTWSAAPGTRVRRVEFRLGAPCYPGDTLTFIGTTDPLTFRVTNTRGVHASGTAVVA
jgi:acyl dehydratase